MGVVPLGDCAAYVEFSRTLDLEVNSMVQRLAVALRSRGLPSLRDVVPALGGVALHFDPAFEGNVLEDVSKKTGLAAAEVAKRHAAAEYRVLMIGFAPGHAYLGGLDARLAVPRRATPRAQVPAGAVAIANEQTVVYPYAISGGWNVIGRTPLAVFDAGRLRPSLFAPGDRVRFRAISGKEFERRAEQQ